MSLKILNISKRRAAFELVNDSPFYSDIEYEIYLNGEYIKNTKKNVFHVEKLFPDTEYKLQLVSKDKKDEKVIVFKTEEEFVRFDVRRFGAKGDGVRNDTLSIQAAIMACPANSTVYFPKGLYRVTSIFLKDNITIEMADEAVIQGIVKREEFAILPGFTETTDESDEYYLGSWEGNPLDSFSSIIQGINVKNVKFVGNGTIDGNAGFHNWWFDAKVKRLAWRPKTISLINCENIVFEGVKVMNSPSWTVHPFFSDNLKFINMFIENPHDSPNTDGIDPESCRNIDIVGVQITVGDDCIAIKSGKIYMGKRLKRSTENLYIRNCLMENGHGGVVVGSEIAAGVKNVKVEKCIFYKTDKGLRLKTRRGRGEDSIVSGINFENIIMDGVKVPFVLNSFYHCDPDGRTEYVGTRKALAVDERTPDVRDFSFKKIKCTGAHFAAGYLCGLPERKVEEVELEDVSISFADNAEAGVPAMMTEYEVLCKTGFYFENIKKVKIKNLEITGVEGEEIIVKNVDEIVKN